jgi:hypothetical protein
MNLQKVKEIIAHSRSETSKSDRGEYVAFDKLFSKTLFGSLKFSEMLTEILRDAVVINPVLRFPFWQMITLNNPFGDKSGKMMEENTSVLCKMVRFINRNSENPLEDLPIDVDRVC